jgi:[phosphatase 2A protein]-leucine-carboxy methyltransferase
MLDETEELELVLAHYAISWSVLVPKTEDQEEWSYWGLKEKRKQEEGAIVFS